MSTLARSCKKRFRMLPTGVLSKKFMDVETTDVSIFECNVFEASKAQSVSIIVCRANTTAWTPPMSTYVTKPRNCFDLLPPPSAQSLNHTFAATPRPQPDRASISNKITLPRLPKASRYKRKSRHAMKPSLRRYSILEPRNDERTSSTNAASTTCPWRSSNAARNAFSTSCKGGCSPSS